MLKIYTVAGSANRTKPFARLSCTADRGDLLAIVCFDSNGAFLDGVGARFSAGSRISMQDPANLGYHAGAMED